MDNAREMGINLLNNACNSMIEIFWLIKWMYHGLEEVREKVGHMGNNRKELDPGN